MRWRAQAIVFGLVAVLGTGGGTAYADDAANRGEGVFKPCGLCHMVGEGARHKVGPILNGIIGAPAASRSGFNYSRALSRAGRNGLVWSEENLDAYLANPRSFLTGGRMSFAGLPDAADRAAVIDYLRSFAGN